MKKPSICNKCKKKGAFGERKRKKERKKERDSFGILYTVYLLRERERDREYESNK